MSGGGGGAPQMMFLPSQQTTSNQLPQWVQDAGKENYNIAAGMSPDAFAAYTGQRVADINPQQWNALNGLMNNQGSTNAGYQQAQQNAANAVASANPYFSNAAAITQANLNPQSVQSAIGALNQQAGQGALGVNYTQGQYNQIGYSPTYNNVDYSGRVNYGLDYNNNPAQAGMNSIYNQLNSANGPSSIANQAMGQTQDAAQSAQNIGNINAQNVNAQTLPQGDISQYLNPYTQNVIDSSLATLDQQRKQALNTNADAAFNAKAFGGSRAAIQDAVTNSQYGLQGAQLAANLNSQNYNQAQSAMQADQAKNLQAQLANQQAGLQAATTNQNKDMNVANLGLNAANQYGTLGLNNANWMTNAANTMGSLGLSNKTQDLSAQQAMLNSLLTQRSQNLDAQRANQSAALQSAGLGLNAQQANMNAALQDRMNAANVAQANQSADLQNKNMNINAIQNAGALGLNNAQLGMAGANQLANIGNMQGALGLQGAQLGGALTGDQQAAYLNGANSSLNAANQIGNWQNAKLAADQQTYNDWQNSILAPLNLRMQALGMTPYNTSTSTSGIQAQAYQPTSSSLGSTLGGLGLMGLSAVGNAGLPGGGTVLGGLLGRGLGIGGGSLSNVVGAAGNRPIPTYGY